ncbi:hypothetical protein HRbin01_00821 [archaeon HR01]|nr:hypothetical protein HRbin01_00821 [archaeon HR01]
MNRSLETALIAVNAALYAGVGYATFLGIFAPVVGTVRFWPVVVIPALFAVVFSPRVGALGAGIGIFISDLLIHGDAILSLTVGVPSNVLGFYILGKLSQSMKGRPALAVVGLQAIPLAIAILATWSGVFQDLSTGIIFIAAAVISMAIGLVFILLKKEYGALMAASSIGLLVGATIIGLGVWAYSQFFSLPPVAGGGSGLPLTAAALWFLFTYLTEIPFLITLLPPLVEAVRRAIPERAVEVRKI